MTTMFDVGDKIAVTLTGEIVEYYKSKYGDYYTIEVSDSKDQSHKVHMSGDDLKSAIKVNK